MSSRYGNYPLIREAHRCLKKKRYHDALLILEKIQHLFTEDSYALFLLTVAYLFNSRFNDADAVLNRLKRKDPYYSPYIKLDAFIKMKAAANMDEILGIYLELIEKHPGDAYYKNIFDKIRYTENFEELQKNSKLADFVHLPPPPSSFKLRFTGAFRKETAEVKRPGRRIGKRKPYIFALKTAAVVLIIAAVSLLLFFVLSGNFELSSLRPAGKAEVSGFDSISRLSIGGSEYGLIRTINRQSTPEFYYSPSVMIDDFEKAKMLVKNGKCNDALIILNRINNSNINYLAKEKVEFVIKFISSLDDRDYENIDYDSIIKKDYLHRGFAVKWKGKVANLKMKEDNIFFSLLVDYRNRDIFRGLAEVYSKNPAFTINNGDIITVEGIFTDSIGPGKKIHIRADRLAPSRE